MSEKKKSLHKTLLILALVFTPAFFLLFTDEGGRISDTALLWLLGEEDAKVNIGELDSGFSESDIQAAFGSLDWACNSGRFEFGDRNCAARIGTFNGYPAALLQFYFADDQLTAMKLSYRHAYHNQLTGYFIGLFGQPDNVAEAVREGPDAAEVLQWNLDKGALMQKKTLGESDEPAVFWLAAIPESARR